MRCPRRGRGVVSSTIIGKLEVLDLGWDRMSWTDAMKLTEELGRGYRLPSPSELRKIYPNLTKTERHWTDWEHWLEKHIAYSQEPDYHKDEYGRFEFTWRPMEENKENLISVILVRDLFASRAQYIHSKSIALLDENPIVQEFAKDYPDVRPFIEAIAVMADPKFKAVLKAFTVEESR